LILFNFNFYLSDQWHPSSSNMLRCEVLVL